MKKILFSFLALIIFLTGCEKDETTPLPASDVYSFTQTTVVGSTPTRRNTQIKFTSTQELYRNLQIPTAATIISSSINYNGTSAVVDVVTENATGIVLTYLRSNGEKVLITVPVSLN